MRTLDVRGGLGVVLAAALLVGCGTLSSNPAENNAAAVESFANEFVTAWESGDPYESARFFAPSVAAFLLQPDDVLGLTAGYPGTITHGEGRSWLSSWVRSHTMTDREVQDVFVFDEGFMLMSVLPEHATASMSTELIEDGLIHRYSVLRWRGAHAPGGAEDERLAWVDELVDAHLSAWSASGGTEPGLLYADEAVLELGTAPVKVDPAEAYATRIGLLPEGRVSTIEVGDRSGRAVFVEPSPNSGWVVYVAGTEADGCAVDQVIALEVDSGLIVHEGRAHSLESIRTCDLTQLEHDGWWSGLEVPPPVEQQVTGTVAMPDGTLAEVINGSPEMEALLTWGLDRFQQADLPTPAIRSVTYGPVPACEGRTGVVTENDDGNPDLVMCVDASKACSPSQSSCDSFKPHVRLALLHELAHVWLLAEVDGTVEDEFMAITGALAWRSADVPWHHRGVEHAAEILAWGLMDEPTDLGRIGSPSCDTVADGYSALTGQPPINTCTQSP